jgi:hypothetical protein
VIGWAHAGHCIADDGTALAGLGVRGLDESVETRRPRAAGVF